jgi:hypothetical protein
MKIQIVMWVVTPCTDVVRNRLYSNEAARSSETMESYHITIRCTNPENHDLSCIFSGVLQLVICYKIMKKKKPSRYTLCGYEVPGTILLSYLKEAMRLDRSKDVFVHISTCIDDDLNALTPVVWKTWR